MLRSTETGVHDFSPVLLFLLCVSAPCSDNAAPPSKCAIVSTDAVRNNEMKNICGSCHTSYQRTHLFNGQPIIATAAAAAFVYSVPWSPPPSTSMTCCFLVSVGRLVRVCVCVVVCLYVCLSNCLPVCLLRSFSLLSLVNRKHFKSGRGARACHQNPSIRRSKVGL